MTLQCHPEPQRGEGSLANASVIILKNPLLEDYLHS